MGCPAHAVNQNLADTGNGNGNGNGNGTGNGPVSSGHHDSRTPSEVIDEAKLLPIPSPPHQHYFGVMGHLTDLDPILPVRTYWKLMNEYSPIYQLDLGMKHPRVFVGSRDLVNEMADDSRFIKFTHRLHQEMRAVFGDGLFSAPSDSKAWGKAHRLLVTALGPVGISGMFDDMREIASQLILKWDRYGPDHEIELIDDMSRLTFDTIGLCAYGYRFNEFYSESTHQFEKDLKEAIVESGRRANRPDVLNRFYYYKDEERRQENIARMRSLCSSIIQERIDNPKPDAKDLLNIMIHGVDRETGETLGFENVIYQIPTLLGGGYETTSSTLSFIFYFLCSNPETLRRAQAEVDEIVGDRVVHYDMLRKLKYLDACMKEGLRMQHPASLMTRFATRDTVLGGRYVIKEGQMVSAIWRHFHRDPDVWGQDADEFRPERMLDAEFQNMPPNSWKPFGDGLRACIGRGFAEQEMLICMAMVLQKFDIEKVDPNYELELKGQMGVKPINLNIRARRRQGRSLSTGIPGGVPAGQTALQNKKANGNRLWKEMTQAPSSGPPTTKKAISVFFGGNQGTCESLVQALSRMAPSFGLDVDDVRELDSAVESLPRGKPCIIITSSYEGRPPYNAARFANWIEKLASSDNDNDKKALVGVKFTVFGAGNSDWVHTFHKVPRLVDKRLEELGAERIFDAGFANVKRELLGPWEEWSQDLCISLSSVGDEQRSGGKVAGQQAEKQRKVGISLDIIQSDTPLIPQPMFPSSVPQLLPDGEVMRTGIVTANYELAPAYSNGDVVGLAKRHLEIRLPLGTTYQTGDYLVVQPINPEPTVQRVLRRFNLGVHDTMTITTPPTPPKPFLPPIHTPIPISHFLRHYPELSIPITSRQLSTLVSISNEEKGKRLVATHNNNDKKGDNDDDDDVDLLENYDLLLKSRTSILDILEYHLPSLSLPLEAYIDMLPPLAPRTYSIASSPLATVTSTTTTTTTTATSPSSSSSPSAVSSQVVSLTIDVLSSPSLLQQLPFSSSSSSSSTTTTTTTTTPPHFQGVASTHLSHSPSPSMIQCLVRRGAFSSSSGDDGPIILLAAGTGIAPMRGILQEMFSSSSSSSSPRGRKVLFLFGCRSRETDYLYREELERWEREGGGGLLEMIPCFSQQGEDEGGKRRRVPDALWEMRERVWDMLEGEGEEGAGGGKKKKKKGTVFVCGSAARLGRSCGEVWRRIWKEKAMNKGKGDGEGEGKGDDDDEDEKAFEWFEGLKSEGRYVTDLY